MRVMVRVARVMVMATKRAIARKRAMVSNNDNKTTTTETTMATTTTTATNTTMTMIMLPMMMKTTMKTAKTTLQRRWLAVADSGRRAQQTWQQQGLSVGFRVLLVVAKGLGRQAGSLA